MPENTGIYMNEFNNNQFDEQEQIRVMVEMYGDDGYRMCRLVQEFDQHRKDFRNKQD